MSTRKSYRPILCEGGRAKAKYFSVFFFSSLGSDLPPFFNSSNSSLNLQEQKGWCEYSVIIKY